ncbi:hypothetical protein SAMN05444161_5842 [Rhizobiales bacterium GAS191]|nr:hypothetical protein SAMN05444161_5842 [Rhizobiales bacterium GAS191]
MTWSLGQLLASLHNEIESRLTTARASFGHTSTKGDATESVWLELLNKYLPRRYSATSAHVVDSEGSFSDQIDVCVFDRQYSPFIFTFEGQDIVPAESVYAIFEAKQNITAAHINYAQRKVASVRALHRTSLAIPYAGGTYPPKALTHILGGILTLGSDWHPPMGDALKSALGSGDESERLDLGCVAAHGHFCRVAEGEGYDIILEGKPATAFLFELIARLQESATVPMIDIRAYARWLTK